MTAENGPFEEVLDLDADRDAGDTSDDSSRGSSRRRKAQKKEISWGTIFVIFAALVCVRLFIAEPFLVYGSSMEPNFETGDYLIVEELSYRFSPPKRGDVVVLTPPNEPTKHFIKRIIGLPGEKIVVKGSDVTIYNAEHKDGLKLDEPYVTFQSDRESTFQLSDSSYFVMGDNRAVSFDSRSWGPLPAENITGKALLRLYPFSHIGTLPGGTDAQK
jgi:signal peptidase I